VNGMGLRAGEAGGGGGGSRDSEKIALKPPAAVKYCDGPASTPLTLSTIFEFHHLELCQQIASPYFHPGSLVYRAIYQIMLGFL
jgi:hypothetical protein